MFLGVITTVTVNIEADSQPMYDDIEDGIFKNLSGGDQKKPNKNKKKDTESSQTRY